jgi:Acyl-CoA carboxylase epsilon subunit
MVTPSLRVVRGEPTAEELAALVAVLAARAFVSADRPVRTTVWSDRGRLVRRQLAPGPGAWRSSARPS